MPEVDIEEVRALNTEKARLEAVVEMILHEKAMLDAQNSTLESEIDELADAIAVLQEQNDRLIERFVGMVARLEVIRDFALECDVNSENLRVLADMAAL